ncbi:hypothetical protein [Gordonia spumicola]|nr:hypothetical protein [Gordonia spumicola]
MTETLYCPKCHARVEADDDRRLVRHYHRIASGAMRKCPGKIGSPDRPDVIRVVGGGLPGQKRRR